MIGNEPAMMSNSEILDKLVEGCVPAKNMKLVSELIANEKFHYVELKHPALVKNETLQIIIRNIMIK